MCHDERQTFYNIRREKQSTEKHAEIDTVTKIIDIEMMKYNRATSTTEMRKHQLKHEIDKK